MFISQYLQWRNQCIKLNGNSVIDLQEDQPVALLSEAYHRLSPNYPKFFKMDILSKLAFLSMEILGREEPVQEGWHTGLTLSTLHGCLDVDLKFEENRKELASPSLFVYTLPNIMLGEICIRHKIKGEQYCFISGPEESSMLYFYTADLIRNRQITACFCGFMDAGDQGLNATLLRVTKIPGPKAFEESVLSSLMSETF